MKKKRFWKRGAALLLCTVLLAGCLPLPAAAQAFTDVPENAWYAPAVEYAAEQGLMQGKGQGRFDPEGEMTRAMFVQVLYQMTDQPADGWRSGYSGGWYGFADVDLDQWYFDAACWAFLTGISDGVGEYCFEPNRPVTREQMAQLLYRYARQTDNDLAVTDLGDPRLLQASPYAREALHWAVEKGILQGDKDGGLRPKDTATRAEAAQVLKKAAPLLVKRTVKPFARVSETAEACGLTAENYPRVDGSTSTLNLVQDTHWRMYLCWENSLYPETASRTVPSYEKLIAGDADLILVPYASAEVLEEAKRAGVELEFHKLALEALVFITPKENPAENITEEQALSIYRDYAIRNWQELGGPDKELVPLCRNAASGSQSQMDNLILKGQPMHPAIEENFIEMNMSGMLHETAYYHNAGMEGESRSCYALGYTLVAYLQNFGSDPSGVAKHLKMLSYNGVAPTAESLQNGSYPLTDGYYAVLRKDTPKDAPARKLLSWYQSEEGARLIGVDGFLPAG